MRHGPGFCRPYPLREPGTIAVLRWAVRASFEKRSMSCSFSRPVVGLCPSGEQRHPGLIRPAHNLSSPWTVPPRLSASRNMPQGPDRARTLRHLTRITAFGSSGCSGSGAPDRYRWKQKIPADCRSSHAIKSAERKAMDGRDDSRGFQYETRGSVTNETEDTGSKQTATADRERGCNSARK